MSLAADSWGQAPCPGTPQTLSSQLPPHASVGSPLLLPRAPLPGHARKMEGSEEQEQRMRVWPHPPPCDTLSPPSFPPSHTPQASTIRAHPRLWTHTRITWPPCPHRGESWVLCKANLTTLEVAGRGQSRSASHQSTCPGQMTGPGGAGHLPNGRNKPTEWP